MSCRSKSESHEGVAWQILLLPHLSGLFVQRAQSKRHVERRRKATVRVLLRGENELRRLVHISLCPIGAIGVNCEYPREPEDLLKVREGKPRGHAGR